MWDNQNDYISYQSCGKEKFFRNKLRGVLLKNTAHYAVFFDIVHNIWNVKLLSIQSVHTREDKPA